MNIYTVRDNLKRTIAGKEKYLAETVADYLSEPMEAGQRIILQATMKYLQVNIEELKKILADVEVCCNQALEASWALNPERMGR